MVASAAALTVAGSLGVIQYPMAAAVLGAAVWGIACLLYLPRRYSIAAPVFFLLCVPADHIRGLNGSVHGYFVLAATLLLGLASGLRDPLSGLRRTDWDLWLLATVLGIVTFLHSGSGEIRGVLFWAEGCLFLFWLRSEERRSVAPALQVQIAIVAASAVGGFFAILERSGLLSLREVFSAYAPNELELSYDLGSRAVGLSGHPLRLGTLTMLGAMISLVWLLDPHPAFRRRKLVGVAFALSLAGLVFSGARGSWLAFVAGLGVIAAAGRGTDWLRRLGTIAAYAGGLALVLIATGFWRFLYERAFGAAAHPESIDQRLQALEGVSKVWSSLPLLGLGFGGAAEFSVLMGLRVLNLENEYLRLFLAGGVPALLLLLVIGVRRIAASRSRLPAVVGLVGMGCVTALMINMATYNLLSWSIGPSLLFAIAYVATSRPHLRELR